ncbi:MAG: MATE family efflux transporter [Elusimicrobiota bacterium]|jgi:MATE family multidrug resistance protein
MSRRFHASAELRSVVHLAAPIALMQTGMVLYGTVDTLMVGRLGPEAIAVVGISGSTYFMLFIVAMGLLLGIDPLSSRAHGEGKPERCVEVLVHAAALALLAALPVFLALGQADRLFALIGVQASVAESAARYLRVLRWAMFPGLLFAACRHFLQSQSITRPQLFAVIAGNVLNALLVWALVFGRWGAPALGVLGAAWATLGASILSLLVAGTAALRRIRHSRFRWGGWRPELFTELLHVGVPAGLQLLVEVAAFSMATMLCGRIGAAAAAAHQITLNLASLTYMIPLGLSHAAAVRVGQGLGKGRPLEAARSGWAALAVGASFMALMSALFVLFPRAILGLYTSDPVVLGIGGGLLMVAAFFQVFDATQIVLTGALRGLGETRTPFLVNLAGHWCVGLPVGAWLAFGAGLGALGLWIGLCTGLCLVALSLLLVWHRRAATLCESPARSSAH